MLQFAEEASENSGHDSIRQLVEINCCNSIVFIRFIHYTHRGANIPTKLIQQSLMGCTTRLPSILLVMERDMAQSEVIRRPSR